MRNSKIKIWKLFSVSLMILTWASMADARLEPAAKPSRKIARDIPSYTPATPSTPVTTASIDPNQQSESPASQILPALLGMLGGGGNSGSGNGNGASGAGGGGYTGGGGYSGGGGGYNGGSGYSSGGGGWNSTPLNLQPLSSLTPKEGQLDLKNAIPLWGNRAEWTHAALETIRKNFDNLDKAKDIDNFCPGYRSGTVGEKEACWLSVASAVAKKESDFDPNQSYPEGPPLNYNSVGLFQLSQNPQAQECNKEGARNEQDLKNPILNIRCGIRIMGERIASYGKLAGKQGAGSYWSVLREPNEHKNSKLREISQLTQGNYRFAQNRIRNSETAVASVAPAGTK